MTPPLPDARRRGLLRTLAVGAGLLASKLLTWPGRAAALVLDFFPVRTVEEHDFSFNPRRGAWIEDGRATPYLLRVDGRAENRLSLSYADLLALPRREQTSDFHCVEGWSVHGVRWAGFSFAEIARLAGPLPEADWVVLHSFGQTSHRPDGLDHYVESLPLADLLAPELGYLLALEQDGAPLSDDHGAPLRLVTPFDLAYKSIKFVTRIEFAAEPRPGWWTLANPVYPHYAPVPKTRLRGEAPERDPYEPLPRS